MRVNANLVEWYVKITPTGTHPRDDERVYGGLGKAQYYMRMAED